MTALSTLRSPTHARSDGRRASLPGQTSTRRVLRVLDDGPSASLVVTSDGVLPIPACPDTRAARHIARCLNHITGATIDVGPDGTHRGTVTGTGHRVLTTLCVGPGAVLALAQAGVPTLLRRPGAAEAIPLTPSLATTTKEYL